MGKSYFYTKTFLKPLDSYNILDTIVTCYVWSA